MRRRELQGSTGLSAPELAWERALELAPAEEIEELQFLLELSQTQEPESMSLLETVLKVWELRERIMRREAPTLAAFFRTQRCLLWHSLCILAERAEIAHEEQFTTSYPSAEEMVEAQEWLRRRRYGLSTAEIARGHAIRAGAEPITDMDEADPLAQEVLKAIDAGDTNRMFRLVGRI